MNEYFHKYFILYIFYFLWIDTFPFSKYFVKYFLWLFVRENTILSQIKQKNHPG